MDLRAYKQVQDRYGQLFLERTTPLPFAKRHPHKLPALILHNFWLSPVKLPHRSPHDGPSTSSLFHQACDEHGICHQLIAGSGITARANILDTHVIWKRPWTRHINAVTEDFEHHLRPRNRVIP